MRTLQELLDSGTMRDDMTREEEVVFVNHWFDLYEASGFAEEFHSPYGTEPGLHGLPFKVLGRIKAHADGVAKEDEADLECLPMWKIEFEDGYTMAAYPEEIVESEISNKITPTDFVIVCLNDIVRCCHKALELPTGSALQRSEFEEIGDIVQVLIGPNKIKELRGKTVSWLIFKMPEIDWEGD